MHVIRSEDSNGSVQVESTQNNNKSSVDFQDSQLDSSSQSMLTDVNECFADAMGWGTSSLIKSVPGGYTGRKKVKKV